MKEKDPNPEIQNFNVVFENETQDAVAIPLGKDEQSKIPGQKYKVQAAAHHSRLMI